MTNIEAFCIVLSPRNAIGAVNAFHEISRILNVFVVSIEEPGH